MLLLRGFIIVLLPSDNRIFEKIFLFIDSVGESGIVSQVSLFKWEDYHAVINRRI